MEVGAIMALFNFDSVEEFAKEAGKLVPRYRPSDYAKAIDRAITGDESYVENANKMLDALDVELPETKSFQTIRSPFGGRVNFGDWLAGAPDPMRRRKRTSTDVAPIKIVVSTTSSGGISAKVLEKRGYAILALVLKLQTVRPIQLYLLTELNGACGWHYNLTRIESQPLALGVAAFALCDADFARLPCYNFAARKEAGYNGGWPDGFNGKDYPRLRRERCGLSDDDLVIGSAHAEDQLLTEPLAWIKGQLEIYAKQGEE
jgi:hypothetical protein